MPLAVTLWAMSKAGSLTASASFTAVTVKVCAVAQLGVPLPPAKLRANGLTVAALVSPETALTTTFTPEPGSDFSFAV